jgi:PGF-CTERM protein
VSGCLAAETINPVLTEQQTMNVRHRPVPVSVRWPLATAGAVLFGLAVLSMAATGAVAAQEVDISIQPAESELPAGEETAFLVVVEDADSGIDGYELNVTLSDAAVAEITAVNTTGDPPFDLTGVRDDGAGVSFEAAMGDSGFEPADEVVIGEVTVVGTTPGASATLTVSADAAVAGANNTQYSVDELHSATVDVVETAPGDGDDEESDDDQSGEGDDSVDSEDGSGPGFGIVSALAALLAVGALVGGVGRDRKDAGND